MYFLHSDIGGACIGPVHAWSANQKGFLISFARSSAVAFVMLASLKFDSRLSRVPHVLGENRCSVPAVILHTIVVSLLSDVASDESSSNSFSA